MSAAGRPRWAAGGSANAIRVPDLEAIEEAVAGMPLQAARLTAHGGWVSVVSLEMRGLSVTIGSFDFPLATYGQTSPGSVTAALPLTRGQGSWNGTELDPRSLWTYGPGAEHDGGATRPPTFAAITLPADEYELLHAGPRLVLRTGDEIARLGRLLHATATSVHRGAVGPRQLPMLERDVQDALHEAVEGPAAEDPRLTSSARIVGACVELTRQHGPALPMTALSGLLEVSDRSIRAAFQREYGLPPSAFFRSWRLHQAHRYLRLATRADTTVTDIAMNCGFWHLGRFSMLYRQRFGELPSATLYRQPS